MYSKEREQKRLRNKSTGMCPNCTSWALDASITSEGVRSECQHCKAVYKALWVGGAAALQRLEAAD